MKQKYFSKVTLLASTMVILGSLGLSTPVLARDSLIAEDNDTTSQQNTKLKLEAAKLKVCQAHEKAIDGIMSRIAARGQRRLDLYSSVADKVEAFYTKQGNTLSNYDALVSDVNTKKAAAQAAVDKVKTDKDDFKCDGSDPKGVASAFRDDLKAEHQALTDYRKSIKSLIEGVRSVQPKNDDGAGNDN